MFHPHIEIYLSLSIQKCLWSAFDYVFLLVPAMRTFIIPGVIIAIIVDFAAIDAAVAVLAVHRFPLVGGCSQIIIIFYPHVWFLLF